VKNASSLRDALRTKKERVMSVPYATVQDELELFFGFLNNTSILKAIMEELHLVKPDFQEWYNKIDLLRN